MGARPNQRQPDLTIWSQRTEWRGGQRGPRRWGCRDAAVAAAIGAEIVRQRDQRGLSQRELANLLNLSQPQVIQYEKGRDQASLAVLFDLEETLRLTHGHFLTVAMEAVKAAQREFSKQEASRKGT